MININYVFIDSQEKFDSIIGEIYSLRKVSLDLETTGLDYFYNNVLLFQVGTLEKQYLIDVRKVNISTLKGWLEDETIIKITVNGVFDYTFLRTLGFKCGGFVDCMLHELILNSGLVDFKTKGYFSMDGMARRYLGLALNKETRNEFINFRGEFTKEQLEYAARDVVVPILIAEKQREKIIKHSLSRIVNLENQVLPSYGDMVFNGFYLDREKWTALVRWQEEKLYEAKHKLDEIFGTVTNMTLFDEPDINYDSQEQLKPALYKLGYTVSDTMHLTLLTQLPYEISKPIIDYREAGKAISSFGLNYLEYINPKTGRLHPKVWQIGAVSGRNSITNPPLQTIKREKEYRDCFTIQYPNNIIQTSDFCLEANTLVTTDKGLVRIEDINIGDLVYTHDNILKPVVNKFNTGINKIYKICTKNGYTIEATENHKFFVIDKLGFLVCKKVKDLDIKNDYFILPTQHKTTNKLIPILDKPTKTKKEQKEFIFPDFVTPEFALFLGLIVGDGSVKAKTGEISFVVHNDDIETKQLYISLIQKLFGILYYRIIQKTNFLIILFYSKPIQQWLLMHGFNKIKIPDMIMQSNDAVVSQFIKGLYDCDGSISSNRLRISLKEEKLIYDLQVLLLRLGIVSIKREDYNREFNIFSLYVPKNFYKKFFVEIGFISSRKNKELEKNLDRDSYESMPYQNLFIQNYLKKLNKNFHYLKNIKSGILKNITLQLAEKIKQQNPEIYGLTNLDLFLEKEYFFDGIQAITDNEFAQTYDLTIEENHSFIANGILTHNSGQEILIATQDSMEPVWVKLNHEEKNIHLFMGEVIFERPIDKKSKEYNLVKNIDFSLLYGAGLYKIIMFHKELGLDCDELKAQNVLDKVSRAIPVAWRTLNNNGAKTVINGYAECLAGRKRFFDNIPPFNASTDTNGLIQITPKNRNNKDHYKMLAQIIREGRNHRIQSSGIYMLKASLIYLRKRCKLNGIEMPTVLCVHDEIVSEYPKHMQEVYQPIIESSMLDAEQDLLPNVKPKLESAINTKWEK